MCHLPAEADAITPVAGGSGTSDRWFNVDSSGTQVPVFEAAPEGGTSTTVIIIHDIFGAREFYQNLARRFAGAGYRTLLPDLFVRQGSLAEDTREAAFERGSRFSYPQATADLSRIVDEVRQSDQAIGTVGFCMGGTLVMLMAAREPRIAAGVIYYGFPANPSPTELRPWEPLQEAALVHTPLLGFWGDQDHGVGMDNVESYRAALKSAGKQCDFSIYAGLPHGFLAFDGSKPYLAESNDSWDKTMAFYQQHLGR